MSTPVAEAWTVTVALTDGDMQLRSSLVDG